MATVTISSPNVDAVLAALSGIRARLRTALAEGTLTSASRAAITAHYKGRLASEERWQVEEGTLGGMGSLHVASNDVAVLTWEFGTRQDRIYPTTKQALAFEIGGEQIVRRSVRGQAGHHQFAPLCDDLRSAAIETWTAAISAALTEG